MTIALAFLDAEGKVVQVSEANPLPLQGTGPTATYPGPGLFPGVNTFPNEVDGDN